MTHRMIVELLIKLIASLGGGFLGFGRILEAMIDISEHYARDPLTMHTQNGLRLTLVSVETWGTFPIIHSDDRRDLPVPPSGAILFTVRGNVQKIGYRFFLKSHAEAMDLRGYIRNLPNSDVEIMLYPCPAHLLAKFQSFILSGPEGARVDSVRTVIL